MKKIGLTILLLMLISFILPILLLKSGNENNISEIPSEKQIKIRVYMADTGKIQTMDLETYILGVVAGEMPTDFHIEALKAQALAARTYTLLRLSQYGGKGCDKHPGADICTEAAHCQAYRDPKTIKKDLNKLKQAVNETAGEVIEYQDNLIDAVFHSTSGGKTENSEDVWSNKVPYLRSVISEYENNSPKLVSSKEVSLDAFIADLKALAPGIQVSKKNLKNQVKILERSEGGRIMTLKIGNKTLKGTDIRDKFGLNSTNFKMDFSASKVLFTVIGYGHGIGMSQYGADGMAQNGSTYQEIIKHYYQGVEIINIMDP